MKFYINVKDISKITKLNDALEYLLSKPVSIVVKMNDLILIDSTSLINNNIEIISPTSVSTSFINEFFIDNEYIRVKISDLFYYVHLLKTVKFVVKIDANDYDIIKNFKYKIHNKRFYSYIIVTDELHFINADIYNTFFNNKETISSKEFIRSIKIKQLL